MAASRPHRCPVAGVVMRWLLGADTNQTEEVRLVQIHRSEAGSQYRRTHRGLGLTFR